MRQLIKAALNSSPSPLVPPWSKLRDRTVPTFDLRRRALARMRAPTVGEGGWRRVRLGLASALWPLTSTARILRNTRRFGPALRRDEGIGLWSQVFRQLTLANLYNVPPLDYYSHGLFAGRDPRSFVCDEEVHALLRELYEGLDWGPLDHKVSFFTHCERHGLPTPRILATVAGGSTHWLPGSAGLPAESVVLKPADEAGGLGFERWDYQGPDRWSRDGPPLSAEGLVKRAESLSRWVPYLIQVCLENHLDLSALAPNALATTRIVSYRPLQGPPGILVGEQRMPRGRSQVDNVRAGGIATLVDPQTGLLLGSASGSHYTGSFDRHPDTQAPISGTRIPNWEQVRDLCLRGHDTFPEFAFVGWDVASTPDGPSLVEANTLWGIPPRCFLGETPFVSCFLEHAQARGLTL